MPPPETSKPSTITNRPVAIISLCASKARGRLVRMVSSATSWRPTNISFSLRETVSRVDATGQNSAFVEAINVLDGEAEWLIFRQFGDFEFVEGIEHGGAIPPNHIRAVRRDVVAVLGGNGDENLRDDADGVEEGTIFFFD